MPGIVCDICGQNEMEPIEGEPNMFRCAYCGTRYTKEQLQERLVKIDGPIKVEGVQNFDKLLENGNTFLKLRELQKAYDVFTKLTNEYPSRYESWYGYVKTCIERNETTDGKIKVAKKVANDLEKMQILQDLKMTASKYEQDKDFQKAIKYHEVIKEGYPEIYLSWFDYVKCNLNMDHVSVDEFKKAIEIANDQEKNMMISELLKIAKDYEKAGEYNKGSNTFELLIQGFPEKAVGYYGYVRENSKKFREYSPEEKFDERLEKANELAKKEENQTYISDLETYDEIKKNILEINENQKDIDSLKEEENNKLNEVSNNYSKEKNDRNSVIGSIKSKANTQIEILKNQNSENKDEIKKILIKRPSGIESSIWYWFLGVLVWILVMAFIVVGYVACTFASGSITLGILGVFLISLPLYALAWAFEHCSDSAEEMHSRIKEKKRMKKLNRQNEKNQKKIDKLILDRDTQVNSKTETDNVELKSLAEERDKQQEEITKDSDNKVNEKENIINKIQEKNNGLFEKISV